MDAAPRNELHDKANSGDVVMNEAAENLRQNLTNQSSQSHPWAKVGIEFGGTLGAGVAGTAFWALASRSELGLPIRLLGTALISGTTRAGIQTGLENAFLDEKERTSTKEQFLWGIADGFAGVAGAAAESKIGAWYTKRLGTSYLGAGISEELAATAGRKAVENSLASKFRLNAVRGIAGGAAGGFTWGVPHSLHDHWNQLGTTEGWKGVYKELAVDTAFGGVTGGVFSTTLTALTNARDLAGYAGAKLRGDEGLTKVRLMHYNDMHSSLLGDESTLSQLSTKAKELRADASKKGMSALLFDAGDNFSGTPEAGLSDVGYVETRGGLKAGVDAFVPGNHVADAGNAEVDVQGWVRMIKGLRNEMGGDVPAVAANIEIPSHPNFSGPNGQIYKPYRVLEVAGPNGTTERVGVVGLVTKELADAAKTGDITYLDAESSARRWIEHLNKPVSEGGEGINKVIVLSHLGRNEDLSLARNVKGISYIVSAHSHDAEPVIVWGRNGQTGWDVPVLQAGSQAKWLGQTDLVFKPTGAADKYRTFGQLHRIDESIPHDPVVRDFLHRELAPMLDLENQKINAMVTDAFHMDGVRGAYGRQTPLGYLVSKGILDGVNRRLPEVNAVRLQQGLEPLEPVNIMLKHTGEIREALPAGTPSQRVVARMFLNTGSVERETRELAMASLTGDELERVLNFGISDFPKPVHLQVEDRGWPRIARMIRETFGSYPDEAYHDYPGNFLQTEGLRYKIDLSKPVGQRISGIEVWDAATNQFVPVDPGKSYRVLTYNHPIEKWNKNGVFGPEMQAAGEQAIRQHVDAVPIQLSQVDLMADYLSRQQVLNPADYISDHITNITPPRWNGTVRPRGATIAGTASDTALHDR